MRDDGSLYVAMATNTSAGVYSCRVRNKYATLVVKATVTVTGEYTTQPMLQGMSPPSLPRLPHQHNSDSGGGRVTV